MSEQFPQSPNKKSYAARETERIQSASSLLSPAEKHLAEIHPNVSSVVEVNTESEDFGRIKDVGVAEAMAQRQEDIRKTISQEKAFYGLSKGENMDTVQNEIAQRSNAQLDSEFSSRLYVDARNNNELATVQEAAEIARKAATDYQITQGNSEAIARRSFDIYKDVANQGLGREGAMRALNDAQRASQEQVGHKEAS